MNHPFLFCLLVLCGWVLAACDAPADQRADHPPTSPSSLDWQGHRGARGLLPENSIPGFLRALELGVQTLEMDLVISADSQVLLSHEPWLSATICRDSTGQPIPEGSEAQYNLFRMPYASIARCDCGTRRQERFPEQELRPTYKPLLREVVDSAEAYARQLGRPLPFYNVEIKRDPARDGVFHPAGETFVKLVLGAVARSSISARCTVQSFDPEALQIAHRLAPELSLALLVADEQPPADHLAQLGFVPAVYSPHHALVDSGLVSFCQDRGMQLIPWTVNEPAQMRRLVALGVDGIITDYPDRVMAP